jgi:isoleucyl-tRNA synthetase
MAKNPEPVCQQGESSKPKNEFKDTLNLPRTDFPIRSTPSVEDKQLLERWEKEDLYHQSFTLNKGASKFVMHDGPPYANGHIHLGTAYNKILKDILCKLKRMQGLHVPVTPGWDCHGLPIELKITQENPSLKGHELKKACREYAAKWIYIQKAEFKNLGVLMDWDNPYLTMSKRYEAATVRAFGKFVDQGYIEKKNKTVLWCASCQTTLASAEVEYYQRKDPSVYVHFVLPHEVSTKIFNTALPVSLLVWTTTPWTLPLNRAVLLKPDTTYVLLDVMEGMHTIVAKERAAAVAALVGQQPKILLEFPAERLVGLQVNHPITEQLMPVMAADFISLEDGTAIVHCAPGCGNDDYDFGVKSNLEIYSPITPDGKYDKNIYPHVLDGMKVSDGQIWVLKELIEKNLLFHKITINHSYPHCWRCRNGLIFRATKQWFCDLAKDNLKQKAIQAVDKLLMLPDKTNNRLKATLSGRLEWCLSRQREWGTPIPALLCLECGEAYITKTMIDLVAQGVEQEGIEFWDHVSVDQLKPVGLTCIGCGYGEFIKEKDILDVWFDSGISHYAVLHDGDLAYPADFYFEGKDQHRGWFQSSLLTSLVIENQPCTKGIITHGYTVDAKGRKMSKSLGNVVAPHEIIEKLGTDGLRLWVASIDLNDAVVSDVVFENVKEVLRKIRVTCRFMLSNLYDFKQADLVPFANLLPIDKYSVARLIELNDKVIQAYNEIKYTTVFHQIAAYCAEDLSAVYLDVIKDRLYVEAADSIERRSAQTVCWYVLDTLVRLIAPILSFTAEHLSDYFQKDKKQSIHLQNFANLDNLKAELAVHLKAVGGAEAFENIYNLIFKVRDGLLKAIEEQRAKGLIKHPLEAHVQVNFASQMQNQLAAIGDLAKLLKELLVVSKLEIVSHTLLPSELNGMTALVQVAACNKCPRCWHYHESSNHDNLCDRCKLIIF